MGDARVLARRQMRQKLLWLVTAVLLLGSVLTFFWEGIEIWQSFMLLFAGVVCGAMAVLHSQLLRSSN